MSRQPFSKIKKTILVLSILSFLNFSFIFASSRADGIRQGLDSQSGTYESLYFKKGSESESEKKQNHREKLFSSSPLGKASKELKYATSQVSSEHYVSETSSMTRLEFEFAVFCKAMQARSCVDVDNDPALLSCVGFLMLTIHIFVNYPTSEYSLKNSILLTSHLKELSRLLSVDKDSIGPYPKLVESIDNAIKLSELLAIERDSISRRTDPDLLGTTTSSKFRLAEFGAAVQNVLRLFPVPFKMLLDLFDFSMLFFYDIPSKEDVSAISRFSLISFYDPGIGDSAFYYNLDNFEDLLDQIITYIRLIIKILYLKPLLVYLTGSYSVGDGRTKLLESRKKNINSVQKTINFMKKRMDLLLDLFIAPEYELKSFPSYTDTEIAEVFVTHLKFKFNSEFNDYLNGYYNYLISRSVNSSEFTDEYDEEYEDEIVEPPEGSIIPTRFPSKPYHELSRIEIEKELKSELDNPSIHLSHVAQEEDIEKIKEDRSLPAKKDSDSDSSIIMNPLIPFNDTIDYTFVEDPYQEGYDADIDDD